MKFVEATSVAHRVMPLVGRAAVSAAARFMLHELGLWCPCRILGPLHAFRLVRRRGQWAGWAYRARLAASILFVSQQALSPTTSNVLASHGANPASNIVLPSVSDT
jgi:hypothetical protein